VNILISDISGKIRMQFIRILSGDAVKVEVSPRDLTKAV
jgi:translation initiation factor IF-1